MDATRMPGKEHCGLPGRIPTADQDDIAPLNEVALYRCCPVRDGPLILLHVLNIRTSILRACRNDHRTALHRHPVLKLDAVYRWTGAVKFLHQNWHGKLRAEFLGLNKCPRGKGLARDTCGKPKVIFDPLR